MKLIRIDAPVLLKRVKAPSCTHPGPFAVDVHANECVCERCGTPVLPIVVLDRLMRGQRRKAAP